MPFCIGVLMVSSACRTWIAMANEETSPCTSAAPVQGEACQPSFLLKSASSQGASHRPHSSAQLPASLLPSCVRLRATHRAAMDSWEDGTDGQAGAPQPQRPGMLRLNPSAPTFSFNPGASTFAPTWGGPPPPAPPHHWAPPPAHAPAAPPGAYGGPAAPPRPPAFVLSDEERRSLQAAAASSASPGTPLCARQG